MNNDYGSLAIAGGARYDLALVNGTVRTGRLPPGVYKLNSTIAAFVRVANSGDAVTSTTAANGMPLSIGVDYWIEVGFADPGYEIQAAAAGAGTLTIFGAV